MTKQEKLMGMYVDSELKKTVETKRNITGGLNDYLKNLWKTNQKVFNRIVELDLITKQEQAQAMTD